MQTTLERCLIKWGSVRRADDRLSYVHRILFNTVVSAKRRRWVGVLRYYSRLTERQMAAVLGVAPGTLKSRLSRAMSTLARDPSMTELRGAR